jgi:hypothetical protein
MALIIIPFDYDETAACSTVPICIRDSARGKLIHYGWFERGVAPVADPLREIADRVLKDVWRVSEIAEYAVHRLWLKHGENLGNEPSLRVLKRAHWHAEDLRVGGRRARRKADVELFTSTLELLKDQFDIANHIENVQTLDRLMDQLERLGMHDVREMVPMMLRDCDADELVSRFGRSRNTISQLFYRGMRRAAGVAGISW